MARELAISCNHVCVCVSVCVCVCVSVCVCVVWWEDDDMQETFLELPLLSIVSGNI